MMKSIARTISVAIFMLGTILAASAAVVTQAVDVAVDQNNNSYVLLLNSDGSNTLNRLNSTGTVTFTATYGPYSGETATAISVGQDGKVRILWIGSTRTMTVWAVTPTVGVTPHYSPYYGPYTSPSGSQYNAIGIATGSDNLTRVLWASTDGYCTFWTLDEGGHAAYSPNYHPDPHYNAIGIAAGNGTVRLLWRKNDNTTTFWIVPSTINATGSVTFGAALPPQTGFYPTDISLDGSNTVYILFNNPSGQTNLWSIASGNTSTAPTTSSFYSLYHNWAADKIASNPSSSASNLRLLWSNTGDTSTLWNLSSVASVGGVTTGGLVTSSLDFGPVSTQTVGTNSNASLLTGNEGFFYGTTLNGGLNNHGTIFRTDANGNTKVIYTFGEQPDGFSPVATLIRSSDGSLYGTTPQGGTNSTGTVYKISPYGVETVLHSFQANNAPFTEGTYPRCRLLINASGVLVGTTSGGGQNNQGTVFAINPSGAGFSTVHSFYNFTDGQNPSEGLIQVAGNFLNAYYGSCPGGGAAGAGTVFRISPDLSTVSVLKSFNGNSEGNSPNSELTYVSANNSLYGITSVGGNGYGVIFQIDGNGNFYTVHSFAMTDGQNPNHGPLFIAGSYLYGTTNAGGANGKGVIYSLNFNNNAYTLLHSFTGTDGANPNGGLMSGADGLLYGTTQNGGANGDGTIFKTTMAGTVTDIHSF